MSNNFDHFSEEDLNELTERFFKMKTNGDKVYFDVDEYEGLIDHFFDLEDAENIEIALNLALEQHPNNYEFLLKKAQLFALHGNDEKGLKLLDELSSLGTDSDYFMVRGSILSNLQKYREAIEEYTKALSQGQDLEEVYTNIAFEYENLEQYDKAIEFLTKVLVINPENEAAINEVGICFEMSNQSHIAVNFFNLFLDKHPYSRSGWFNLAISYNSLEKNKKAIESYEFSLAIDENQASALFNIANIYAGMGQHTQAIKYYKETLTKESPDALTYYYLGESYEKLDDFDKALNAYEDSYDLNSNFHESILGMARCYYSIGDERKAFQHIDKAIDLKEPFPLFWSIRSLKLEEHGFFKLAKALVLRLIKKNPKESIYYINLAVLLRSHTRVHSVQVLNDALLLFTDNTNRADLLYIKGLYQIQDHKIKWGIKNFEKAILLDRDEFINPLIQAELSNISNDELTALIKKYKL